MLPRQGHRTTRTLRPAKSNAFPARPPRFPRESRTSELPAARTGRVQAQDAAVPNQSPSRRRWRQDHHGRPPAKDDSTTDESSHGPMRCASATTTTPVPEQSGDSSPTAVVSMPVTASNEAAAGCPGATRRRTVPAGQDPADRVERREPPTGAIGEELDCLGWSRTSSVNLSWISENRGGRVQGLGDTSWDPRPDLPLSTLPDGRDGFGTATTRPSASRALPHHAQPR